MFHVVPVCYLLVNACVFRSRVWGLLVAGCGLIVLLLSYCCWVFVCCFVDYLVCLLVVLVFISGVNCGGCVGLSGLCLVFGVVC